MQINEITEYKKGRKKILLDDGTVWILYKGEIRSYQLKIDMEISEALYQEIHTTVIGKRAKKRALYLLEKMDRTESGLREKLRQNEYPPDLIDDAITYVKSYHYIDDERYAKTYIGCYQCQRSRQRIKMDLLRKGINKQIIEDALLAAYENDERQMIQKLLIRRKYNHEEADRKEQQKIYQFLLRRGFKSEDVLQVMKCSDYLT